MKFTREALILPLNQRVFVVQQPSFSQLLYLLNWDLRTSHRSLLSLPYLISIPCYYLFDFREGKRYLLSFSDTTDISLHSAGAVMQVLARARVLIDQYRLLLLSSSSLAFPRSRLTLATCLLPCSLTYTVSLVSSGVGRFPALKETGVSCCCCC